MELKEQYVIDDQGNRIGVLLGIEEYQKLLEASEELEAIQAYDRAMAANEEEISFEAVISDIEKCRQ